MKSLKPKFLISFLCLIVFKINYAQVSIINISVQSFNIIPEALLNVGIMNNGPEQQVQIYTQIFNSSGAVILSVKSNSFKLLKGLNSGMSGDRKVQTTEYGSNSQSNYIKSTHNLPSGRYKICSSLLLSSGSDKLDDFCDELEAEFNQYLYLVNPFDNDTIDQKYPILTWTHAEPFTILNQGEFYRMVVTEMKKDQTPEEAINVNSPVMLKNYVKEHQLQYPFDAKELKNGSKYAWQVQKIGDGVIINKTEAWAFNLRNIPEKKSLKYVAVKPELDGSFYTAYNGEVFFKFSEEYNTAGNLKFSLLDDRSKPVDIQILKDKEHSPDGIQLKQSGDNRFDLNLNSGKVKPGFYTLIVKNEKNESFYLKIFVP